MNKKRKPLELYVHIPFCIRKCAYCDFVSGPGTKAMQKEYEEALLAEMRDTLLPKLMSGELDVSDIDL